jgi:hypothetical protein
MEDRLIELPKDEDISIPLSQVIDWLRQHGKTEKEMEQRYQKVQRRLKKFAPEIKKLRDRLANILRSGPLRSQRFQIAAPDFESALYVDLVEMLSKNGLFSIVMVAACQLVATILLVAIANADSMRPVGLYTIRTAPRRKLGAKA